MLGSKLIHVSKRVPRSQSCTLMIMDERNCLFRVQGVTLPHTIESRSTETPYTVHYSNVLGGIWYSIVHLFLCHIKLHHLITILCWHMQSRYCMVTENPPKTSHSSLIRRRGHDDVTKWKYFAHHWPFVRGIHRSPVNSPHKGQWRGALMFSLICSWIDGWVNNGEAGDLRRHRVHYDVIVMIGGMNPLLVSTRSD